MDVFYLDQWQNKNFLRSVKVRNWKRKKQEKYRKELLMQMKFYRHKKSPANCIWRCRV
jgi:hypothetical protein